MNLFKVLFLVHDYMILLVGGGKLANIYFCAFFDSASIAENDSCPQQFVNVVLLLCKSFAKHNFHYMRTHGLKMQGRSAGKTFSNKT